MRKYWIVLVDDDAVSLKNARNLLNGEELKVSSVRSGKDLLTFMNKNIPDLILMDVLMPEMDGFETYKKLREFEASEGRRNTPVIFLTGEEDSDAEHKGLQIGASDFIRKPINKEVLIRRVYNIISNHETIENLTEETVKDKLTGFFNKRYTDTKLPEICENSSGLLMVMDLDNFKLVNDLYGHDNGDEVLRIFAKLARDNCKTDDIICRIGGDEFLIFFRDTVDENIASAYVQRINGKLLEECIKLFGVEFSIPLGVSAGCIAGENGGDYDEMFHLADKALYQVKRNGKHGCQVFDKGIMTAENNGFDVRKELNRMMVLCSEREETKSAMVVSQDSFIPIYRYLERYAKRHNEVLTRLLFSFSAHEALDVEDYLDAISQFEAIMQENLRKNDVITKNKSNCYFLIFPELGKSDTEEVVKRIMAKWEETRFSDVITISYVFDSIKFGDN